MRPLYFFTDRLLAATVIKLLPRRLTPNLITTFRFLTVPAVFFLLIFERYDWSGGLFLLAVFTDMLDGALARTTNQITNWGKLFDPLADKLLIGSAAAVLVTRFLSFKLAAAIIAVELLLILSGYYYKYYRRLDIQANYLGKTKMVLQSIGLLALFGSVLGLPSWFWLQLLADDILTVALIFAILSFFGYRSI